MRSTESSPTPGSPQDKQVVAPNYSVQTSSDDRKVTVESVSSEDFSEEEEEEEGGFKRVLKDEIRRGDCQGQGPCTGIVGWNRKEIL